MSTKETIAWITATIPASKGVPFTRIPPNNQRVSERKYGTSAAHVQVIP